MRIVALILCLASTRLVASDTLRITLDQAIEIALQNNFDIQLAKQDSLLARNLGATSITGFLPKVNLNGNVATGSTNIDQTLADGRVIGKNGAAVNTLSGNAALQWTLFDGLKMFANANRLRALEAEGLARVRASMQTVVADVLSTYSGIVAFQQFQSTVDSALVLAEQRYEIAQRQYDVGATSGVELAQARIDLNTQRALVISMRADLENASTALLMLLARPQGPTVVADNTLPPLTLPTQTELIASVDTLNPDMIAMQKALEAASAHVSETNAAFMPQLGVNVNYQFNRVNQAAGFVLNNQTLGWSVGAQLQWNIFNGFADNLARERALVEVERSRIEVYALRNTLRADISRAYRNFAAATAQYQLEAASYTDAQTNASVAVEGLRLGTVDALQVRQSLLTLLDVGERVARRDYERRLAATEILRLSGLLVR